MLYQYNMYVYTTLCKPGRIVQTLTLSLPSQESHFHQRVIWTSKKQHKGIFSSPRLPSHRCISPVIMCNLLLCHFWYSVKKNIEHGLSPLSNWTAIYKQNLRLTKIINGNQKQTNISFSCL